MEINSHNQLLILPSPLLIKTRKQFLELAGMREVCLIPQSSSHSLLASAVVFCTFAVTCLIFRPTASFSPFVVVLSPCMCCVCPFVTHFLCVFPSVWQYLVLPSSFSVCPRTCTVCCMGSHVVDLGLKLWLITPIMNHHALFRLSFPTGIDCIMKLSFSLSNCLCPHVTLLTNTALHRESVILFI